MKVLVFGAALVCVCAAHSHTYGESRKQRNSHSTGPAQSPPLAYASQGQYTQQYGAAPQASYQESAGGSAQRSAGYGRPEPEEDEYQPGYGQPAPARAPASTHRPISHPRPTQSEVRATRQPWSHQQTIQHRQPQPSYAQPQKLTRPTTTTTTTRKPTPYSRPTTRRVGGYASPGPEDSDTAGYGKPLDSAEQPLYPQPPQPQPSYPQPPQPQPSYPQPPQPQPSYPQPPQPQPSYPQPSYPQPPQPQPSYSQAPHPQQPYPQAPYTQPAPQKKQSGGYGNDLEDLDQPGYGGPQPAPVLKQTGGHGIPDLEHVETGGYGGPGRAAQDSYAESRAFSDPKPGSRYYLARELPTLGGSSSYFESRSNPDYFPQLTRNAPAVAPVPAFQLQAVQQPPGYLVVDQAHQW